MTVNAYVRCRPGATGTDEDRHPVEVVELATAKGDAVILDVPLFGLYAVGDHPELGPLATYITRTPGVEPEPALCTVVDGRLEVRLLADRLTLVVEGYPMEDAVELDRERFCPDGTEHEPLAAGDANDGGPIHCHKCQWPMRGRNG
jgi:hypothetical protein